MSADTLFYAGIGFSLFLAGFLSACVIALLLSEPADDPFGDTPHGDWPALPADLKASSFHERKE